MGTQERKEREKEHRREEILDAAQRVFFDKGLQSSTMDEIAEAAELSKGTLYLYYKSKEDLYLAVMIRGMDLLYEMFSQVTSKVQNPIESIRAILGAYSRFFHQHRSYFRMFHFFQHPEFHRQVSEDMLASCSQSNTRVWALGVDIIRRGVDAGLLRSDISPEEVALLLWSNANAIMMRIDYEEDYWKKSFGIDLSLMLKKSNDLILEAVMTEKAKKTHLLSTAHVHKSQAKENLTV